MRVKRDDNVVTIVDILGHILHLGSVYVRHTHLHRGRKVDDDLVVGRWLPYIDDGVANFQRVVNLRTRKALGRILEVEFALGLLRVLLAKFGSEFSNVHDLLFGLFENLFSLRYRSGIVEVYDSLFAASERLESLLDNMLSRLGENLYLDVVGYEVLFDKSTQKFVFRLACGRESYFDFFET